ncbi:ATP-dependent helicase HepA [Rhodopirellula maiorica SM1]|uniref:ATP-dependent helicase HepA n=1 Tax=Rhodopirellula maiorica SM1 TaxID=1265738 RepID=M5S3Y7_9BACT|nr:DEAD/DEAH box helicase family protein [Rhodopirellula maiorica]EMI22347.1 ATP-dependent helicase HepA [Rhodopirellula maiorica SM1]
MPAIDDYELMMHGVQAVRRLVEGLACPINGASGIRAQFFPHQVQNVQRILSSTQIRFLIADEVGMGKTVQALMVAHAMRYQSGKIRVKVVVSNSELKSQWIKEFCRIDKEVKESEGVAWIDNGKDSEDFCNVMDESELPPYSRTLDPLSMDLLIVDEPQNLSVDSLRYLSDRAADFPAILLLTATPNFRDLRRFCELLQILEPERMEFCRRQASADGHERQPSDGGDEAVTSGRLRLRDLDTESLQRVFNLFEQLSLEGADEKSLIAESGSTTLSGMPQYQIDRVLFDAKSTYRHVLLSSREDYPQHLPRRKLKSMLVEPTAVETQRMSLARQACHVSEILSHTEQLSLLQRGCLGGQSIATFTRYLTGQDDEKRQAISPMLEFVKKEQADCRLDALVDWLSEFWRKDPTRKAVICAGDDATVRELAEELSWRLPQIGKRGCRVPLKIVMAESNAVGGSDLRGLSGADAEQWRRSAESTVEPYSTGKTQLLVASDEYGQAINLQCSDVLILLFVALAC